MYDESASKDPPPSKLEELAGLKGPSFGQLVTDLVFLEAATPAMFSFSAEFTEIEDNLVGSSLVGCSKWVTLCSHELEFRDFDNFELLVKYSFPEPLLLKCSFVFTAEM
jgi:hypothetical protein